MSRSYRTSRPCRITHPSRRVQDYERGSVLPMDTGGCKPTAWILAGLCVAAVAGFGLLAALWLLGALS